MFSVGRAVADSKADIRLRLSGDRLSGLRHLTGA
jgi:hypothetical protein